MPTATLKGRGIVLNYEDSGIPNNSTTYTTVFLLHAFLFDARIFLRLFPYAASHNIRLIAPYMREYDGSTPFTEEELERYYSDEPEDQETTIHIQALELAEFMAYIIDNEKLPLPTESNGVKSGGVSIMTWSAGCASVISLLANIPTLEESVKSSLERYLSTVIIHDPPSMCYGVPEPIKLYHPFRDNTLSKDEVTKAMLTFVFTYYESFKDLASVTADSIAKRKRVADVAPDAEFTITKFTPQEFAQVTNPEVAARVGPGLVEWEVYAENSRRALLDTQGAWPNVRIVGMWGAMTCWSTIWGTKALDELIQMDADEDAHRRNVTIVRLEGANHFFAYDKPEAMMHAISEHVP